MAQENIEKKFISIDQVVEAIDSVTLPSAVKRSLLEKVKSLKYKEGDNLEIVRDWYYNVLKRGLENEDDRDLKKQTLSEALDFVRDEIIYELLGIDHIDLDWLETVKLGEITDSAYDRCKEIVEVELSGFPSLREMRIELEKLDS